MPDFWDRTVVDVLLLSLPPTKIQLIATNCSGPVKHIKSTSHFRRSIYVTNKLNLAKFYWKYHHHHSAHCRMGPLDECARVSTTMFTVSLPLVISSHCLSYNQFARGQATNIQIINENTKRISNWNLNAYIYSFMKWFVARGKSDYKLAVFIRSPLIFYIILSYSKHCKHRFCVFIRGEVINLSDVGPLWQPKYQNKFSNKNYLLWLIDSDERSIVTVNENIYIYFE